jgi:hypothetical protein
MSEDSTDVTFLEEIKAALGTRNRKIEVLWYISAERVQHIPLALIEDITHCPSLVADACRLQGGGLLFVIYASRTTQDKVEEMLGALGALYGIIPAEVV